VSSTGGQIAAMDNEVRRNLPQVGENGLERAPIAVNIRYDGDFHFVHRRACEHGSDAAAVILQWSATVKRLTQPLGVGTACKPRRCFAYSPWRICLDTNIHIGAYSLPS